MSDLAKWNVRGPVRTLRTEFAEWNLHDETWQPPRTVSLVQFLPDGRVGEIETRNPDGSVFQSNHLYDATGRLTEVQSRMNGAPISRAVRFYDKTGRLERISNVDHEGTERQSEVFGFGESGEQTKVTTLPKSDPAGALAYSIEGTELSYDASGAATVVTVYDEGGRPREVLFRDGQDVLLRRVVFKRDGAGRVVSEEMQLVAQVPFACAAKDAEGTKPDDPETTAAVLAEVFGPGMVMLSTTYEYDQRGRVVERRTRYGALGEERNTFRYDDRGNRVEHTVESVTREMETDDRGKLRPAKETSHKQTFRIEHLYDAQGNWVERTVWSRLETNPDFQRSNIERREITYYEP